jgi:predicted RNA-binding Zn ribbon-like protein
MSTTVSANISLLESFVNTTNLEDHIEELATPADLRRWLREAKLLTARDALSTIDLERAIAVREALRALIAVNSGEPLDPHAHAILQEAAERSGLTVRFRPDGSTAVEPVAAGVDGAIGGILAAAHSAMERDEWRHLKVCGRDCCRWAFVDTSKNQSKRWCSMEVCGNRQKSEAFRRRHTRAGDAHAG